MNHSKRFLFLMIALVVSVFFSILGQGWANLAASVFFLLSLIAAAYSISKSRRQLLKMLGVATAAILPVWQIAVPNQQIAETIDITLWIMLTFYIGLMIFKEIMRRETIRSNEIYGAISVYLLIGVVFGLIYQIILVFDPQALYFNPTNFKNTAPHDGDIFYFSFITLSTVGYGDVSPVAPIVRSVGAIEAILGVMYMATMIARFIAGHATANEPGNRTE